MAQWLLNHVSCTDMFEYNSGLNQRFGKNLFFTLLCVTMRMRDDTLNEAVAGNSYAYQLTVVYQLG